MSKNRDPTLWFVCKICKRAFHRGKYLLRHKRTFHPKKFKVEINNNNNFKTEQQQLFHFERQLFPSNKNSQENGPTTTTVSNVNSSLSPVIEKLDDGLASLVRVGIRNKILKNENDQQKAKCVIRRSGRIAIIKEERETLMSLQQKFGYTAADKGRINFRGKNKCNKWRWSNYDSKEVQSSSSSDE